MGDEKKCPCDAMLEAQHRLREHDVKLADGNTNFALLNQSLKSIESDMAEVKSDVKELMEKPSRRWDKVVEYVLLAVIAYFLAAGGIQ